MGFGILFFGYLITYLLSLNPYAALTRLAGYLVCLIGLRRLRRHNRWFAFAYGMTCPLLALALANTVIDGCSRVMGDALPSAVMTAGGAVEQMMTALVFVFHLFLLWAVYTIAADTGLPQLGRAARRNLALIAAYAVMYGVWSLPIQIGDSYRATMSAVLLAVQLLWTILDLVLLFRCYMWICLEGDEEMPRKPSRFAFVNRVREKFDAHDAKAAAEAKAYAEQKRAELHGDAGSHSKGKKKKKRRK